MTLAALLELTSSLCSSRCVTYNCIKVAIHGTRQLELGAQTAGSMYHILAPSQSL